MIQVDGLGSMSRAKVGIGHMGCVRKIMRAVTEECMPKRDEARCMMEKNDKEWYRKFMQMAVRGCNEASSRGGTPYRIVRDHA